MTNCCQKRPQGKLGYSCPITWNLKMMTSYAVFVQNTLKLELMPSALASNTYHSNESKASGIKTQTFWLRTTFCQCSLFRSHPLENFASAHVNWRNDPMVCKHRLYIRVFAIRLFACTVAELAAEADTEHEQHQRHHQQQNDRQVRL